MATYSDVVVSIQSGAGTTNDVVFYTCPTGKFAKVSLRIADTSRIFQGTTNGDPEVCDSATTPSIVYLTAGQQLYHFAGGGFPKYSFTAFEYSAP